MDWSVVSALGSMLAIVELRKPNQTIVYIKTKLLVGNFYWPVRCGVLFCLLDKWQCPHARTTQGWCVSYRTESERVIIVVDVDNVLMVDSGCNLKLDATHKVVRIEAVIRH